jgi:zinc/manganese transport system substrate-binding protein
MLHWLGASRQGLAIVVVLMMAGTAVSACTSTSSAAPAADGRLVAVGAENQYADVISQIGGRYVSTSAVLSNPNTDPHTFESSPQVAEEIGSADLVVQNGLGYDTFMNRIESAAVNPHRLVIDVQTLLGLPDSTPNPHLWYKPSTMPAVAAAIGRDLSALQPHHAAYFAANLTRFDASLAPWYRAIASFKASHQGVPVATTEPVGDYLLEAAGTRNLTPFTFQADIMNGLDPSPQDVSIQTALFTGHKVKVFVYNQQVTDALTQSLLALAHQHHIPVVGVYETMPTPGYHYQSWMVAEVDALEAAVAHGTSSPKL